MRTLPWLLLPALVVSLAVRPAAAQELPASEVEAVERLDTSPRHGEWVTVSAGDGDEVRAWISYPERSDPAPVVVVIHEIFGLTDWIRAVADQLAADGYIAIAPDLLSGKGPAGGGTESVDQQEATALIRDLTGEEVDRRLQATAAYGTALPAATDRVASIGFCWGGTASFTLATAWPELDASIVYYGTSPDDTALTTVTAPILGLYGEDDARVNATIDPARAVLDERGRSFEVEMYEGAGHGFLRQQEGRDGANLEATRQAWPRTLIFLEDVFAD